MWNGWKCDYIVFNVNPWNNETIITRTIGKSYTYKDIIEFSKVTEDKFYEGQRVICRDNNGYKTKNEKGTIVKKFGRNQYIVNFDNDVNGWDEADLEIKWGHGLYVLEDLLEPLEELKEEKQEIQEIHITIKDRKTIAVLKENGKVTKRAEAICCPTDEFDAYTGADIALDRLFGKTEKNTIEVGDMVEIIDTGKLYTTYKGWFEYAKLECYEKNYIYNGDAEPNRKYKVVGRKKDAGGGDILCLIQNPITLQVFIISEQGIKKV